MITSRSMRLRDFYMSGVMLLVLHHLEESDILHSFKRAVAQHRNCAAMEDWMLFFHPPQLFINSEQLKLPKNSDTLPH